jgi:MFS family permease
MFSDYSKVVKNKYFIMLWMSQVLSQLTINIVNFTFLIRLFALTGSAIATSMLWVSYAIPAILIGPIAAAVVDIVNRRKILILTNFLQALTIFLFIFVHERYLFLIYGIAIIYSFLNQFYVPAEFATLPSLVKKEDYPTANSLFFMTQQVALIVGFGIAGVLNQFLGFADTLFIASVLLFVAFLSVWFLPKLPIEKAVSKSIDVLIIQFFTKLFEGYDFIKRRKDILLPFILLIFVQVGLAVIIINIPLIATDLLNIDIQKASYFVIVPAGIGALFGAVGVPKLIRKKWRKKRIIDLSLLILSVSFLALTFLVPDLPPFIRQNIGFLISVFAGASFVGVLIPAQTYLQEATPGGYRGRVFGNFWFLVTVVTILPVIFSGAITELLGIKFLFLMLFMCLTGILVFSKKYGAYFIASGTNM